MHRSRCFQLKEILSLVKLTGTESGFVRSISTIIVVITILCGRNAIVVWARKFTNWTLIRRVFGLCGVRLLDAVNACGGVAQVQHYNIDFVHRNHFHATWFHFPTLFFLSNLYLQLCIFVEITNVMDLSWQWNSPLRNLVLIKHSYKVLVRRAVCFWVLNSTILLCTLCAGSK